MNHAGVQFIFARNKTWHILLSEAEPAVTTQVTSELDKVYKWCIYHKKNHTKNMMKVEENNDISTSGYIMNKPQSYFGQN